MSTVNIVITVTNPYGYEAPRALCPEMKVEDFSVQLQSLMSNYSSSTLGNFYQLLRDSDFYVNTTEYVPDFGQYHLSMETNGKRLAAINNWRDSFQKTPVLMVNIDSGNRFLGENAPPMIKLDGYQCPEVLKNLSEQLAGITVETRERHYTYADDMHNIKTIELEECGQDNNIDIDLGEF